MTDYQDALVLENLDLVNWVIRTRISIPNRPLLTYDDFYAIGCEAICRAALKYQPDKLISVTIENGKCEHLRYMRSKGAQCSQKIFDCMHELILKVCSETEE